VPGSPKPLEQKERLLVMRLETKDVKVTPNADRDIGMDRSELVLLLRSPDFEAICSLEWLLDRFEKTGALRWVCLPGKTSRNQTVPGRKNRRPTTHAN
jgi:hypothetical protein